MAGADTTLLDMMMVINGALVSFAASLMKSSLRFAGVYTKA